MSGYLAAQSQIYSILSSIVRTVYTLTMNSPKRQASNADVYFATLAEVGAPAYEVYTTSAELHTGSLCIYAVISRMARLP